MAVEKGKIAEAEAPAGGMIKIEEGKKDKWVEPQSTSRFSSLSTPTQVSLLKGAFHSALSHHSNHNNHVLSPHETPFPKSRR